MFNLLHEYWIPVITRTGRRLIRPFDIVDPAVLWPDWPRADLNVACLELLIGMVAMADPPRDPEDWDARRRPDAARWAERLGAFAEAFALDGPGPRFMQDLEPFEVGVNQPGSVDMLFIDSAGESTAGKNADMMVHRGRYAELSMGEAAMALFALQAYAPSGGAGNRTSMRGGGPLTTLIIPGGAPCLFDVIWANVPEGRAVSPADLPWMKPAKLSNQKQVAHQPPPGDPAGIEMFFGVPRRLRIVFDQDCAIGVVQRPRGANYEGWVHPLSPYYRMKAGEMPLPVHPKAGRFGYRNWLGIICEGDEGPLNERAQALRAYGDRADFDEPFEVLVAGWAMANMAPLDFTYSRQPMCVLTDNQTALLRGLIRGADVVRRDLVGQLTPLLGEKSARDAAVDAFYEGTEAAFVQHLRQLRAGAEVGPSWLAVLRRMALALYDDQAQAVFVRGDGLRIERVLRGRQNLLSMLGGYSKSGVALYEHLRLEPPKPAARSAKAKGIAA